LNVGISPSTQTGLFCIAASQPAPPSFDHFVGERESSANSVCLAGFLKWSVALAANSETFGARHRHCAMLARNAKKS
jgi:hypothetical protein